MNGRVNQSTLRKSALVPLCSPQIPHGNPGSNHGHSSGKSATNRLSYGMANRVWTDQSPYTVAPAEEKRIRFTCVISQLRCLILLVARHLIRAISCSISFKTKFSEDVFNLISLLFKYFYLCVCEMFQKSAG
jgi:hypothetical protein